MPETDIGSTVSSDLTNAISNFSVGTQATDGPGEQKETTWTFNKWTQYFGYYNTIPELTSTIDARATWTVGKGFKADIETTFILESIKGYGSDTFNTILENMIRDMFIAGDSFAEIIRHPDTNEMINLKPLDPGAIRIVVNQAGIILRYEQISKVLGKEPLIIPTEKMFHLVRNRVADQIHGTSVVTKLEPIILKRNEAMEDYQQVLHRYMKPRYIFHLDTDDTAKIAQFKAKTDKAWADGENQYIPKGAVVPELMAVAPNATLDPKAWIDQLNDYFYEAVGTPKVIVGGAKGFTEAAVKIVYLAFQQSVEEDQLYIEEQVGLQLGMVINLEFPASLENELISDNKKDGAPTASQPSDTTAGVGE